MDARHTGGSQPKGNLVGRFGVDSIGVVLEFRKGFRARLEAIVDGTDATSRHGHGGDNDRLDELGTIICEGVIVHVVNHNNTIVIITSSSSSSKGSDRVDKDGLHKVHNDGLVIVHDMDDVRDEVVIGRVGSGGYTDGKVEFEAFTNIAIGRGVTSLLVARWFAVMTQATPEGSIGEVEDALTRLSCFPSQYSKTIQPSQSSDWKAAWEGSLHLCLEPNHS